MNHLTKIVLCLCLLVLTGCGQISSNGASLGDAPVAEEKPPALLLTIDGTVMQTARGGYSWSYPGEKLGETVHVEADSVSPFDIVNLDNAVPFHVSSNVQLLFADEPLRYEIKVWDTQREVATYSSFAAIEERGRYAIEIIGYWEAGRGTYVCALNIHS